MVARPLAARDRAWRRRSLGCRSSKRAPVRRRPSPSGTRSAPRHRKYEPALTPSAIRTAARHARTGLDDAISRAVETSGARNGRTTAATSALAAHTTITRRTDAAVSWRRHCNGRRRSALVVRRPVDEALFAASLAETTPPTTERLPARHRRNIHINTPRPASKPRSSIPYPHTGFLGCSCSAVGPRPGAGARPPPMPAGSNVLVGRVVEVGAGARSAPASS